MRRLSILCLFPCLLAADDHWVKFTSGPFEVLTDAGARAGRETVVRLASGSRAQPSQPVLLAGAGGKLPRRSQLRGGGQGMERR